LALLFHKQNFETTRSQSMLILFKRKRNKMATLL